MASLHTEFDARSLIDLLPKLQEGARFLVAFSGGADSSALLYALSTIADQLDNPLLALHLNHQLHRNAGDWQQHCVERCRDWDVALRIHAVELKTQRDQSVETAAREARYRWLADNMRRGDCLLTAHHAEDQAETVLLNLMRGTGPKGLGGIRSLRQFHSGVLARPLLGFRQSALRDYLTAQGVDWIEDDSNQDDLMRRNFLRNQVLPLLGSRWPQVVTNLCHSAALCQAGEDEADAFRMMEIDRHVGNQRELDLVWLGSLSPEKQATTLRSWLAGLEMELPGHRHLHEIMKVVASETPQRSPNVGFGQTEVRRHKSHLFAMPRLPKFDADWHKCWDGRIPLQLPPSCGVITLMPTGRLKRPVEIRLRRGGERLIPSGHSHTRSLKKLLQEADIPAWLRNRIPLVYRDETLLAVADLWITDAWADELRRNGTTLVWERAAIPGSSALVQSRSSD